MPLSHRAVPLLALLTVLSWPSYARADGGRISFLVGNYNYSTPAGSASGLASYSLLYAYDAFRKVQVFGGATATLAKAISGAGGFGFDIGLRWFPLTAAGLIRETQGNIETVQWETWRPYVGLALRQRTFAASSQASYVGTGLLAGLDYQLNERFSLVLQLNYDKLTGPGAVSATQVNANLGGSIHF